ncbi:MAG: peptidylprolyl isomerase [Planctomycetota bacterium]|jgi:parvulin-like peptidyl-prolyl isomerase
MKKSVILPVLISLVIAAALTGCRNKLPQGKFTDEQMKQIPYANKYDLPAASGGMVLGIYSETVTAEEILNLVEPRLKTTAETSTSFESFQQQAAPFFREAIRGKVTDILLYQEARKTAPENIDDQLDKAVENEIVRFVASYNNNYALAEAAIDQMGMTWNTFRQYQKKLIMTQSHLSSQFDDNKRYSYQELMARYEAIKAEQFCQAGVLEFSLIDIFAENLTDEQRQDQTYDEAAKRLVKDLMQQLEDGADFAELAKQHSHGPLAKLGGKWQPVTIGSNSIIKPYDIIEEKALDMSAGKIKGPVITDGHYLIIKLHKIEEGGCRSFDEVQDQIVMQLKFQQRQQQYQKLVMDLIKKADIVQIERFNAFCIKQAYERWSQ